MNKSRIALIVLVAALVLLAGLFAWQASVSAEPPSGPEASNPNAPLATPQPLSSYQRIQNIDPVAVSTMTVTVYTTAGAVQGTAVTSTNPFYSALVDERSCCSVGSGFAGSGVVNATTDIAAVTFLVSGGAGTSAFRSDAYTAVPGPGVFAGPQFIPQVQKGVTYKGQTLTNTLAIQNAGSSAGDIYITVYALNNVCGSFPKGSSVTFTRTSVPANATTYVDFSATGNGILDGCAKVNSSVVVTGTQPLAIVNYQNADAALLVHTGFIPSTGPSPVDNSTSVLVPQAYKNSAFGGLYYGTGITMLTQDQTTQTVTLTLQTKSCTPGPCVNVVLNKQLSPSGAVNLSGAGVLSYTQWYGAVQVDSPVPVAVIANNEADDATGTILYGDTTNKAFPLTSGTTSVFAPHVIKNQMYPAADGVTWLAGGLNVVLIGVAPANQTLYCNFYIDPPTGPAVVQYTKTFNTSTKVCSPTDPQMNAYPSFHGSALVTSTVPIVATVTQVISGTSGIGDGFMTYPAINR